MAYTYYWQYTGYDPYCNVDQRLHVKRLYHGTGFTDPNRLTAWDEPGFLRRSGWIDAAWVDNSTVLLSDPYILPNEDTVLWSPDDAGLAQALVRGLRVLRRRQVKRRSSRDKSALATVTEGGKSMSISRTVGGFHPDYPTRCFEAKVDARAPTISSPTFNADGSRLFWAEAADGIHAAVAAALRRRLVRAVSTDGGGLLIAGASSPSWGPAEVPPARPAPQPPVPTPTPTPTPGDGSDPGETPVKPAPGTPGAKAKLTRHQGQARGRAQEGPDAEAHRRARPASTR